MVGVGVSKLNIREFLNECRKVTREIRSVIKQREAVKIPLGPKDNSASIVGLKGKDNDPTTTALNNIDYYDELLRAKEEELKSKMLFFESVLNMLPDGNERTVLRYYFAQGLKDAEIAEEIGVDIKTAANRRRSGVRKLERKF